KFNIGRKSPVSKSTIRKILQNYGMNGRIGCKKPLLRKVNIAKRLIFSQKHVMWTKAQWSKVLFTDESKFCLFGSNSRVF
ncbi:Uncharacterized protein APZ42_008116, partial [Daphnia magna]